MLAEGGYVCQEKSIMVNLGSMLTNEIICPADASHVFSNENIDQFVEVLKEWKIVFDAYPLAANVG